MVATSVLSIALLGIAQLLGVSVQINSFSRYNTVGIQVARGKLSELKAIYDYQLRTGEELADLNEGDHGPVLVTLPAPTAAQNETRLSVSWTVNSLSTEQKDVTVSVRPLSVDNPESQTPRTSKTVNIHSRFVP